jgi:hypothetical protein
VIDLRTEPDGTVTAKWAGRLIRDARRGFYTEDGQPLSPTAEQRMANDPTPAEIWRGMKAVRLERA